jgi:hypothetical protein
MDNVLLPRRSQIRNIATCVLLVTEESRFVDFVTRRANSCTQSLTAANSRLIWLLGQMIGLMEYS